MPSIDELITIISSATDKTINENDYDSPLSTLGFSSMELLLIHQEVEEHYNIEIPYEDIYDYPTLNKLHEYLDSRMSTK